MSRAVLRTERQASVASQAVRFEHMEHTVGLIPSLVAQLAGSAVLVLRDRSLLWAGILLTNCSRYQIPKSALIERLAEMSEREPQHLPRGIGRCWKERRTHPMSKVPQTK